MALNKITVDSIAANAVTNIGIANGTIVTVDLADSSVTGPKLGLTAINANNIVDGTITLDKTTGLFPNTGGTITANVSITGSIKPTIYQDTFSNVAISSGTVVYDLNEASIFRTVLTEDATSTFSNPPSQNTALSFVIQIEGFGQANTFTWPSNVKYKDNTAPTIDTTTGYINTFAFYTWDSGATYVGTAIVGQYV